MRLHRKEKEFSQEPYETDEILVALDMSKDIGVKLQQVLDKLDEIDKQIESVGERGWSRKDDDQHSTRSVVAQAQSRLGRNQLERNGYRFTMCKCRS